MASLGDLMLRVGVVLDDFHSAMSSIPEKVADAASKAQAAWAPIENLGMSLLTAGAGLTAGITVPLVGIGTAAVKVSENLNMANIAFTTMLGSGEKARAFLGQLQQFAASTPFEFPDLVEASKRMMAMGFEASQVIPVMRTIGDSVAALGGGKDVINGVTLALGQMQSKGKVSAQEMNQLAERGIPAWKMLADQIGVSIPEAMKLAEKGAISAATAVPAILAGMQEKFGGTMAQASQTLTGVWSNFKDQISFLLMDIGTTLTPALKALVEAAMPVLTWAKDAAHWFAQLPEPIRNGALAIAAVAAAAGPLLVVLGGLTTAFAAAMPAFEAIAAFIGLGSAGALAGPALAIVGVTGALVALGTWVYENWEPVKAVVTQAWDGLKEIWMAAWGPTLEGVTGAWNTFVSVATAIWNPIAKFFSTIWDGVGGYFTAAWNGIAAAVQTVWEGIKSVAMTVWGAITSAIGTFLEAAAKIPGVNKLINLDDAWASAKKAGEELKNAAKSTDALKKSADSAGGTGKPIPKLAAAIGKVGDEAKDAHEKLKPLITRNAVLDEQARQLEASHKAEAKEIAAAKIKLAELGDKVIEVIPPSDELNASIQKIIGSMMDLSKNATPPAIAAINSLKGTSADLDTAFKTLGVTSATEYNKVAEEAKKAYEVIRGSGIATPTEQNNAMLAMLKAQKDAMIANGKSIPAEMQATIDRLGDIVKDPSKGLPSVTTVFTTFSRDVSGVISDGFSDIGRSLFDGDLSWGGKLKNMVSGLKDVFVHTFIDPVTNAIGDFISGALADLLGGKGFGGIIDSVKSIGSSIAGVFGGGGAAASAAGGVMTGPMQIPQGPGGIPGVPSGGGAGGAAGQMAGSSVAGIVGAAAGVVDAISGVIGNFQFAHMNTALGRIEESTRYTKSFTENMLDKALTYWPSLPDIHQRLIEVSSQTSADGVLGNMLGNLLSSLGDLRGQVGYASDRLGEISSNTYAGLMANQDAASALNDIRDTIRNQRDTSGLLSEIRDGIRNLAQSRATTTTAASNLSLQGVRF